MALLVPVVIIALRATIVYQSLSLDALNFPIRPALLCRYIIILIRERQGVIGAASIILVVLKVDLFYSGDRSPLPGTDPPGTIV